MSIPITVFSHVHCPYTNLLLSVYNSGVPKKRFLSICVTFLLRSVFWDTLYMDRDRMDVTLKLFNVQPTLFYAKYSFCAHAYARFILPKRCMRKEFDNWLSIKESRWTAQKQYVNISASGFKWGIESIIEHSWNSRNGSSRIGYCQINDNSKILRQS